MEVEVRVEVRCVEPLQRLGVIGSNKLKRVDLDGQQAMDVQDLGNAESLLGNAVHFDKVARRNGGRRRPALTERYSGWLGRYQDALDEATERIDKERSRRSPRKRLSLSETER
jgi:hypothetical protein